MKTTAIIEVLNSLIGPYLPAGCSAVDEQRLKNIKTLIGVIEHYNFALLDLVSFSTSQEQSVKEVGQEAKDYILNLKYCISENNIAKEEK